MRAQNLSLPIATHFSTDEVPKWETGEKERKRDSDAEGQRKESDGGHLTWSSFR